MSNNNIIAGIVIYNPNIDRLYDNINAIVNQVDQVILFNNGGIDHETIESLNCIVLSAPDNSNVGIAKALNKLCEYAAKHGYEWIITLDQDSVVSPDLIDKFSSYMHLSDVAIICPRIVDRNINIDNIEIEKPYEYTVFCITSASLVRLDAWKAVGGFWNELFIDLVDFDFCWSIIENRYKILKVNNATILHEVGHGKTVSFKNKKDAVYNHAAIRCYYIARNNIAVGIKHKRLIQCIRWTLKRMYLIARYEESRSKKLLYMIKGTVHGFTSRLGEYQ